MCILDFAVAGQGLFDCFVAGRRGWRTERAFDERVAMQYCRLVLLRVSKSEVKR